jgi:hypothetical protein
MLLARNSIFIKSSCDSISDAFTSQRLQNWNGRSAISQHGLVPQSLSFAQDRFQVLPHPDNSTRFHKIHEKLFCQLYDALIVAELLARPLCGLVSHQLPDLHAIISSSSALKHKEIRAALRIPPANTASAT